MWKRQVLWPMLAVPTLEKQDHEEPWGSLAPSLIQSIHSRSRRAKKVEAKRQGANEVVTKFALLWCHPYSSPPKSWDRSTGHQPCCSSWEFVRTPMELFPLCAYWLLGKDLWKSQPLFHSGISHRCPSHVKPCLLLGRRTSSNNSKRRVSKGPTLCPDFPFCALPFDSEGLCWLHRRLPPRCSVSKFCKEPFFLSPTLWCLPQLRVCFRKNDVDSWRTNPAGPDPWTR